MDMLRRTPALRRARPPALCPKPVLDSVRSKLRKISPISRSYLFGIPVLFLELARTLFVLMIPTSQLGDKGFVSQFGGTFEFFGLFFYFTYWRITSKAGLFLAHRCCAKGLLWLFVNFHTTVIQKE